MSTKKTEPKWKIKLLEWQASGLSAKVWCAEHQIPISTFYSWQHQLKKLSSNLDQSMHKEQPQQLAAPHGFIELKNRESAETGIVLECCGVKIHLLSSFNPCTLKQCIACLRGATC